MAYHKTNNTQGKAGPASRTSQLSFSWPQHSTISSPSPAPPTVSHERAESQRFVTTGSPTQALETLGNVSCSTYGDIGSASPMTDAVFFSLPASIDEINQPLPNNHAAGVDPKLGLHKKATGEANLNRPAIPSQNNHINHASAPSENDTDHKTFETMVQESAESLPFYNDELFGSNDPSTWGAESHDALNTSNVHNTPDNSASYEFAHDPHRSSFAMTPVTISPDIQGEMNSSLVSPQANTSPSEALDQSDAAKQHIENPIEVHLEENRGREGGNSSVVNQSHTSPNVGDAVTVSATDEDNKQMVSNPFSDDPDGTTSDIGAFGTPVLHGENDLKHLNPISRDTDDGFADRPELYRNLVSESLAATDEDSTSTHFTSLKEARESLKVKSRPPTYDPSVPQTVAQKRAFVKRLNELFWALDNATDNDSQKKPFKSNSPDPRQVELACWEVLEATIRRETRGAFTSKPQKGNVGSFASRMAAIMEAVDSHKTICKHLLRVSFLDQFIDDPIGSRCRVISNQRLNKDKANLMKLGKQVKDNTEPKAQSKAISSDQKSNRPTNGVANQNSGLQPQLAVNASRPLAPAPRAASLEGAINTAQYMGNNSNVPGYPTQYAHQQIQNFRGGQYQVPGTPSLAQQSLNSAMYSRTHPVSNDFDPSMLPAYNTFQNPQASQMLGVNHNPIQQWPHHQLQENQMNRVSDLYMNLQANQYNPFPTPATPSQVSQQSPNPPPVTKKRGRQENQVGGISATKKRCR